MIRNYHTYEEIIIITKRMRKLKTSQLLLITNRNQTTISASKLKNP